jgi:hypothetical protein
LFLSYREIISFEEQRQGRNFSHEFGLTAGTQEFHWRKIRAY